MATLPPAISSNAGGSKKPFSYCPGGIDFSELKSPKIARRIAKHQAGINEPSSTLPPQQKTPTPVPSTPPTERHPPTSVSPGSSSNNTKTLPNRPVTGRQRSISDLLSSDVDTNTPSSSFPPSSSPATPYNPYSSDRSISIPPPTPPPIVPQQPLDPVNRAISL